MNYEGTSQDIEIPSGIEIDSITAIVVPLDVVQYMNYRTKISYEQENLINNQDSLVAELKNENKILNKLNTSYKVQIQELNKTATALAMSELQNKKIDLDFNKLTTKSKKYKKQRNRSILINIFTTIGTAVWLSLK